MELQFSSGMVAYPDRVNTGGEEYRDGEAPIPGSIPDVVSQDSNTNTSLENSHSVISTDGTSEGSTSKQPLPYNETADEKAHLGVDSAKVYTSFCATKKQG